MKIRLHFCSLIGQFLPLREYGPNSSVWFSQLFPAWPHAFGCPSLRPFCLEPNSLPWIWMPPFPPQMYFPPSALEDFSNSFHSANPKSVSFPPTEPEVCNASNHILVLCCNCVDVSRVSRLGAAHGGGGGGSLFILQAQSARCLIIRCVSPNLRPTWGLQISLAFWAEVIKTMNLGIAFSKDFIISNFPNDISRHGGTCL